MVVVTVLGATLGSFNLCVAGIESLKSNATIKRDDESKYYGEYIIKATDISKNIENVLSLACMQVVTTGEFHSDL